MRQNVDREREMGRKRQKERGIRRGCCRVSLSLCPSHKKQIDLPSHYIPMLTRYTGRRLWWLESAWGHRGYKPLKQNCLTLWILR